MSAVWLFSAGESRFAQFYNVILSVFPVIWEVNRGIPVPDSDFPGTPYRLLFLCCAMGSGLRSLFAIIRSIPPSWVAWFASVWDETRDKARGAGTKARAYVLGVYYRS